MQAEDGYVCDADEEVWEVGFFEAGVYGLEGDGGAWGEPRCVCI